MKFRNIVTRVVNTPSECRVSEILMVCAFFRVVGENFIEDGIEDTIRFLEAEGEKEWADMQSKFEQYKEDHPE